MLFVFVFCKLGKSGFRRLGFAFFNFKMPVSELNVFYLSFVNEPINVVSEIKDGTIYLYSCWSGY